MYRNRWEAGELLTQKLAEYHFGSVCVLGIPRGGIVVAVPVARFYKTTLEVLVTRKIGHPFNDELAVGAVMPDGSAVLDTMTIEAHHISQDYLDHTIAAQYAELRRRMNLYTGSETPPDVKGKTTIIVDDGIATGYTMKAAISWLKTLKPAKIIIAVPVAPPEVINELAKIVDIIVCPLQPPDFMAVGMHYQEFPQTTDAEAIELLREFKKA